MKNILMPFAEKTILRKRFFIMRTQNHGACPVDEVVPLFFCAIVCGCNYGNRVIVRINVNIT